MAKATKKKPTNKSKSKNIIQCKKSHGHLVCWVPAGKNRKFIILKLWLLPTKLNGNRPHLIRSKSLFSLAVLLIGLQFAYNFAIVGKPKILGYATDISVQDIQAEVNAARSDDGLSTLSSNQQLNKAASLKADDMIRQGYWSHNSPSGVQPWTWFDKAGYDYQDAGENLAKDFNTSKGVTSAWLGSESHRRNMLNPDFKNIGVAVVNGPVEGRQTTLVVVMFGVLQKEAVPIVPASAATGVTASATASKDLSILAAPTRIGSVLNPVNIVVLGALLLVAIVALLTHFRYIRLPKQFRRAWYRHSALYTAFLALLAVGYTIYVFTAGSI